MKIEKAIETLKDMRGYFNDRSHKQYSMPAIDLAISALEKQMPKKPIYNGAYFATHYKCSECGRLYWEKEYLGKYCDECGQLLDWEAGD